MRLWSLLPVVAALLLGLAPAVQADLAPYAQDFELLIESDTSALTNDGWLVFGNVWSPDGQTYLYGYGPFPAPNDGAAFCAIDVGQGGPDQGVQQLSVYNDYNNLDHGAGNRIESNVFQEQTIGAANVGQRWTFAFDAKLGNLTGSSTALAFIKTLDPASGYALTNFISVDMTSAPVTWQGYTLSIDIDAALAGQILQIGFLSEATLYEPSGVFYDNLDFYPVDLTDAPPHAGVLGMSLAQNTPNPFNPTTRIPFSLEKASFVEITVYDLAGRHVATLLNQHHEPGDYEAIWDGRADGGARVASGQYRYVLRTSMGDLSRGMTLLK